MENQNLLEVRDLTAVYKTDEGVVRAVNGITFSIGEKETIGLVGETGAGKTTTALSIMGLLPERTGRVEKGEILYRGQNILKMDSSKLREVRGAHISMIFQDPMTALNPIMTVGDQIRESLEIHSNEDKSAGLSQEKKGLFAKKKTHKDGSAEVDKRVEELLELVGIPAQRKNNYPHEFSGGMKQRIVIAIALACQPLLLIADEPTTALDVTIQAQVLALMDELKEKFSTSMIMITHDLGVVAETCDKVAVMYAGEIVEYGSKTDIFDESGLNQSKEHHPYTVGLFNAIPNLTVETDRLSPIDGLMPDPMNLPEGCRFHPRCPHCTEACKSGAPYLYEKDGHQIRCNLMKVVSSF